MPVHTCQIKSFLATLFFCTLATTASAEPDPNFHIYLMVGQSNMEGAAPVEAQDKIINDRVKVMSDLNCSNLNRTYGNWYAAVPPLNRCWSGLGPGDYFGKTMADGMPSNITIGLVPAAVSGTPIELFQKSAPLGRNGADIPTQFNGGYAWLLDMAKKAQVAGVIKGIIFHQGESNNGDPQWKFKVKEIVTELRTDLGIGDVPFLAGETLYANYGSCCSAHNVEINMLPNLLTNAYVISAAGLPGLDAAHFTTESYRELGKRYAAVMLDNIHQVASSSMSTSSASATSSSMVNSSSSVTSSVASSAPASASSAPTTGVASNGGGGSVNGLLMMIMLFASLLPRLKRIS